MHKHLSPVIISLFFQSLFFPTLFRTILLLHPLFFIFFSPHLFPYGIGVGWCGRKEKKTKGENSTREKWTDPHNSRFRTARRTAKRVPQYTHCFRVRLVTRPDLLSKRCSLPHAGHCTRRIIRSSPGHAHPPVSVPPGLARAPHPSLLEIPCLALSGSAVPSTHSARQATRV